MTKKIYLAPSMEVIRFTGEDDVLTTSEGEVVGYPYD